MPFNQQASDSSASKPILPKTGHCRSDFHWVRRKTSGKSRARLGGSDIEHVFEVL